MNTVLLPWHCGWSGEKRVGRQMWGRRQRVWRAGGCLSLLLLQHCPSLPLPHSHWPCHPQGPCAAGRGSCRGCCVENYWPYWWQERTKKKKNQKSSEETVSFFIATFCYVHAFNVRPWWKIAGASCTISQGHVRPKVLSATMILTCTVQQKALGLGNK